MNGATKASARWALAAQYLLALLGALAVGCSDANSGTETDASIDTALDASTDASPTFFDGAKDAPTDATADATAGTAADATAGTAADATAGTAADATAGTAADATAGTAADATADATLCQNTTTDPANCGSCGHACLPDQVCSSGACTVSCSVGLVRCTVDSGPALCIITQTDNANCGACGNACAPGMVCSAGMCGLTCQVGLLDCGGNCVDPATSRTFCGATGACQGTNAGAVCAAGQVCNTGTCAVSCPGSEINCNDTCIDPNTTNQFCGATGTCDGATAGVVCAAGQVCSGGTCGLTCQSGLVRCGGTCVDPTTDRLFCGAGSDCLAANAGTPCAAGQVCSGSVCMLTCQAGLVACNGTCVDPVTSNQFCGASADCSGMNAGVRCQPGQVCSAGLCGLSCQAGLTDCGGTCVDPGNSNQHCGAPGTCGVACLAGNVCNAGTCGLSCQAGMLNCGGTCFDPTTSRAHCGATLDCAGPQGGAVCGAGEVCNMGVCSVSCPSSQVNCGGSCVNPLSDPNHCGAIGDCSSNAGNNAGVACTGGATCQAGTCACPLGDTLSLGLCCPTGGSNCGGVCVNEANDPLHCGSCSGPNQVCSGGMVCGRGVCAVSCPGTQVNCGGSCVAPATDPVHCGAVGDCSATGGNSPGTACTGGATCQGSGTCLCPAGETLSSDPTFPDLCCPTGQSNCGGVCVNEANDPNHCGACRSAPHVCSNGTVCSAGVCGVSCPGPQVNCNGSCVAPATDPIHCGAIGDCSADGGNSSGTACAGGAICQGGACLCPAGETLSSDPTFPDLCCPTGQSNCSGCTDTQSDPMHCGGCGTTCSVAHATNVCASGQCALVSCDAGYSRCPPAFTGMPVTSCAIFSTDVSNCGGCGHVCSFANAPASCVASTCTMGACNAGFTDCNGDPTDGCEIAGAICPTPNIVFTTSVAYTSNLGGLAGADAKCGALATAANLAGTFLPWLSDGPTTPASRFTHPAAGWTLVDGTFVASNWVGLTSKPLRHAISLTETGGTPPTGSEFGNANVWSGTNLLGANENFGTCSSWTGSGTSGVGSSSQTGSGWTNSVSGDVCDQTSALFCFQQ